MLPATTKFWATIFSWNWLDGVLFIMSVAGVFGFVVLSFLFFIYLVGTYCGSFLYMRRARRMGK